MKKLLIVLFAVIFNTAIVKCSEMAAEMPVEKTIHEEKADVNKMEKQKEVKPEDEIKKQLIGTFSTTGYNLDGCGKSPSHPDYGVTASGYKLTGNRTDEMCIAVDPKVIQLGTKVYVEFVHESYQHLNGWYTARDTGGKWIQNLEIDIYMGEDSDPRKEIGRQDTRVYKIVE